MRSCSPEIAYCLAKKRIEFVFVDGHRQLLLSRTPLSVD